MCLGNQTLPAPRGQVAVPPRDDSSENPPVLLRRLPEGALAIAQPAHAWLAGRLAAAWAPWPRALAGLADELAMAAGIHDLAWGERDAAPVLDPSTSLPQRFVDVPVEDHVALWERATGLARPFGPLPALLVSQHGTRLLRGRAAEGGERVATYLAREEAVQRALREELARSPVHAGLDVARAGALIAAWDALSLHACHGPGREILVADVPWHEGSCALRVAPAQAGAVRVVPWPFAPPRVRLAVPGRPVAPARGQTELEDAWRAAELTWLELALVP